MEYCKPCPVGHTANQVHTKCQKCEPGNFTPRPGSPCVRCPENTIASEDQSHCIPLTHFATKSELDYPLVYHPRVFSSSLASNSSDLPDNIDYRICKSQSAYCTEGFFGPIF